MNKMKMPNTWRETIERGYVTTDMLDACALTVHKRYLLWLGHVNAAKRRLEEHPDSKAAARRLAEAETKTRHYARMRRAILSMFAPQAVMARRRNADLSHYIIYVIGDRRYVQPTTAEDAEEVASKHGLVVTETRTIHHPKYDLQDLPSLYVVLSTLATIRSAGIDTAVDTGGFDHGNAAYEAPVPDLSSVPESRLVSLSAIDLELTPEE